MNNVFNIWHWNWIKQQKHHIRFSVMFIVHVHALDEIEHEKQKNGKLLRQQTRRISRHAPCVERENAVCTIIWISMQIFIFPFFAVFFSQNHFVSFPAGSNSSDFYYFRVYFVNTFDSLHLIFYSSCRNCRGIGEWFLCVQFMRIILRPSQRKRSTRFSHTISILFS